MRALRLTLAAVAVGLLALAPTPVAASHAPPRFEWANPWSCGSHAEANPFKTEIGGPDNEATTKPQVNDAFGDYNPNVGYATAYNGVNGSQWGTSGTIYSRLYRHCVGDGDDKIWVIWYEGNGVGADPIWRMEECLLANGFPDGQPYSCVIR